MCSAAKLIVRNVAIQRADHVVAIFPGIRNRRVELMAARFRVANEIEPVPSPAFAVVIRSEQPIDDFGEGVGRGVSGESLSFRGGWRETG